jgi:hypothetical protein
VKLCAEYTEENMAMPWLRRLVTGLPPRRSGFAPGSVHVGFVGDKVAMGQVFSQFFGFSLSVSSFHQGFILISYGGRTIGPLVAAVQRHYRL